jgi:hypothetical protein
MKLTRRDALAALAAGGVTISGGTVLAWETLRATSENGGANETTDDTEPVAYTDHEAATLFALAEVLYPSVVEGIEEFVETYVVGRARERPSHAKGAKRGIATLDDRARAWYDDRFAALSVETRDQLLREMALDTATPDPTDQSRERLRYYLVNELLYALYTTPTGGKLASIENPIGYPGGTRSYQRGPR